MENRELEKQHAAANVELYALGRRATEDKKGLEMLKTPFWKKAAASLPAHIRARHIGQLEAAERWELALDGAVELWSRVKATFAQPRAAH